MVRAASSERFRSKGNFCTANYQAIVNRRQQSTVLGAVKGQTVVKSSNGADKLFDYASVTDRLNTFSALSRRSNLIHGPRHYVRNHFAPRLSNYRINATSLNIIDWDNFLSMPYISQQISSPVWLIRERRMGWIVNESE